MDTDTELHLGVSLEAAFGKMDARLAQIEQNGLALGGEATEVSASSDTTTITIAGTSYLVLRASQQVPSGERWEVRSLRVGADTPVSSVSGGTCFFFASRGEAITYQSFRDQTSTTLPLTAFYSAGQFVLYPFDRLVCLIASSTSGHTYQFSATALRFPNVPLKVRAGA